jgi:tyrosyl-DNA phosphodiesterase-1
MEVPVSVKSELLKFDFSKAKAKIVASVSGVFEGEEDYKKYGHTRLAYVVRDIVNTTDPTYIPTKVEMQVKNTLL